MQAALWEQQVKLPAEIFAISPKIARGENYRQLPYVMADYPRVFSSTDTIAVRTLFWWGNFFSTSLQVSGKYQPQLAAALLGRWSELQQSEYWIAVGDSAWEHHFEAGNFSSISALSKEAFNALLQQKSFIKIAKKIPLQQWDDVPGKLMESFNEMTGWLML